MEKLRHIIIAAAVFVPIITLAMWLSGRQIGRKLTRMLERLYHGDLTATEEFDYVNVQAMKLYYPFTVEELRHRQKASPDSEAHASRTGDGGQLLFPCGMGF